MSMLLSLFCICNVHIRGLHSAAAAAECTTAVCQQLHTKQSLTIQVLTMSAPRPNLMPLIVAMVRELKVGVGFKPLLMCRRSVSSV